MEAPSYPHRLVTGEILDAAYEVHRVLGPGLLESAYSVKSVDSLQPVHTAQVLTYIRLAEVRLGLLINFNTYMLKHGIKRLIR